MLNACLLVKAMSHETLPHTELSPSQPGLKCTLSENTGEKSTYNSPMGQPNSIEHVNLKCLFKPV